MIFLQALRDLTSRWREKVFALMVQAEASALTAANEHRMAAARSAEAARQLERTLGQLTQTELKLRATEAELAEERSRRQVSVLLTCGLKSSQ